MKVCMIVVNSVSHDARVLKEAGAIRDMGLDVVIVGIQDAKNSIPIEFQENGVVIRRVGWRARALKPWLFQCVLELSLALLVSAAIVFGLPELYALREPLLAALTPTCLLGALGALVFCLLAGKMIRQYRLKKKRYEKARRAEEVEVLKYAAFFERCHTEDGRDTEASAPSVRKRQRRRETRDGWIPRPLLGGVRGLFSSANRKLWKSVFSREKEIYAVLLEECPDLVHAHDLNALPVAVRYRKAKGVQLIFDAHECYDQLAQAGNMLDALNHKLLKRYSGYVDGFVTINDSIAQYYASAYPRFPKATIIKNAAQPVSSFVYDGRLHKAAGLPAGQKILLYQGGFALKRGLDALLLSVEYLNPDWTLIFMGWGNLEDSLRKTAAVLKLKRPDLSGRIRFLPKVPQDELPFWTAGASLGVIPYENSGLNHWFCTPNKLWEYPNASVPILASPFPEMRKVIEKYQIGFLLPDPLAPSHIARIINDINSDQLAEASRNCRNFIRQDNWNVYAKRLCSMYRKVI